MRDRNTKIIEAIRAYTDEIINDPAKLAAWADKQRKWQDDFDAFMQLDRHDAGCHCQRCLSEFFHPATSENPTADTLTGGSSDIDSTLAERGERYGSFPEHARITQAIKAAMIDSPNWTTLAPDQREALEMVAHKAGRILNGDPDYHDSWRDIVGYAKLVADRLVEVEKAHGPGE